MKNIFKIGDSKTYVKKVTKQDFAAFEYNNVHEVCSTFSLAQAIEWSSRLFVLELKEVNEEGIGTKLTIEHVSPAFINDEINICSVIKEINKNELICTYQAKVNNRIIAFGETGQKILDKSKINSIFNKYKTE